MKRWSPWAIVTTDSGIISDLSEQTVLHGEKRLMLAVLESATEDFQKYVLATNPHGKQLFQDAEDWFLAGNDENFFSFENVCHYLQLDPDYIRKGLSHWKETQRAIDSAAKPNFAVGQRRVSDPPIGYRRSRAAYAPLSARQRIPRYAPTHEELKRKPSDLREFPKSID